MRINKKVLKKILIILMLTITLMNFLSACGGNNAYAADSMVSTIMERGAWDSIADLLSGIVAILTLLPRLLFLVVGYALKGIINAVASISDKHLTSLSFEHILFSGTSQGLTITDIDFFNLNTGNDVIDGFRSAVAQWYYIMRLIAAAALLVILIYVGIRMALSTVASEQAKYKHMLVDWVTSIALLFLLHYIMIFIISINSALVQTLADICGTGFTVADTLETYIVVDILTSGLGGIIAAVLFAILIGYSFMYLLFYLKRMITVAFLIIIAPLVTITYAIDKIGDGKAQALNAWLKEFSYNVLIQPFHCVIYLAFFGAITSILYEDGGVFAYILALMVLSFMKSAEGILRKIFHFESHSMPAVSEPAKAFFAASGQALKVGKGIGQIGSNFKEAGGMNKAKSLLADHRMKKDYAKSGSTQSYDEYKESNKETYETYQHVFTGTKLGMKMSELSKSLNTKKDQDLEDQALSTMSDEKKDKYAAAKKKQAEGKTLSADDKAILKEVENKKSDIKSKTPKGRITGVAKNVDKFMKSDAGQLLTAYTKDSMKAVSGLMGAGVAYGMGGDFSSALMGGQLAYGIADAALDGTTKRTMDNATAAVQQVMHNNNVDPQKAVDEIKRLFAEADINDINGVFKQLQSEQMKAIQAAGKVLNQDIANAIMRDIKVSTSKGEEFDIGELIDKHCKANNMEISNDDRNSAIEDFKNFSNMLCQSQLIQQYKVLEPSGMDPDSFVRKLEKTFNTTNVSNYNYDYTTNQYVTNNNTYTGSKGGSNEGPHINPNGGSEGNA